MYYASERSVLCYDSLCSSDLACVAKSNSGDSCCLCISTLACVAKPSRNECEACLAQSVVACVAQP